MSGELGRWRCHFVGHVQHRGFRYACWTCARKAGVTGWVRNEANGTVTAEAQGTTGERNAWLSRLASLVEGYGDGWSVGTMRDIDVVPGEGEFAIRRY